MQVHRKMDNYRHVSPSDALGTFCHATFGNLPKTMRLRSRHDFDNQCVLSIQRRHEMMSEIFIMTLLAHNVWKRCATFFMSQSFLEYRCVFTCVGSEHPIIPHFLHEKSCNKWWWPGPHFLPKKRMPASSRKAAGSLYISWASNYSKTDLEPQSYQIVHLILMKLVYHHLFLDTQHIEIGMYSWKPYTCLRLQYHNLKRGAMRGRLSTIYKCL